MGIDVNRLSLSPVAIKQGKTQMNIMYYGVVDNLADNPVNLDLFIEPAAPAFFISGGKQVKRVKSRETFATTQQLYSSWIVEVEITSTPASPTSCSIRLESTDAKGNRSSVNSFLIYS